MQDSAPAIRAIDVFDSHQCSTLLDLQRAAYQVEADLIAFAIITHFELLL